MKSSSNPFVFPFYNKQYIANFLNNQILTALIKQVSCPSNCPSQTVSSMIDSTLLLNLIVKISHELLLQIWHLIVFKSTFDISNASLSLSLTTLANAF